MRSKTKRKLMKHQVEALRFLRQHKGIGALFMACGVGKTLVAIKYADFAEYILIICRRDDFYTWQEELFLEGFTSCDIQLIESGAQKFLRHPPLWNIVTYDLIRNEQVDSYIRSHLWEVVIADESHSIKRWRAKRTKAVIKATRHIDHRIVMTGTPITNDPGDTFTQILFVDNGRLFGSNYWKFRNIYYIQAGPGWYLKHNAKKRIISKLKSIAFYVDADDVLKLPPIRRLVKAVPMSGQQRKHYEKILNEWEVQLPNQKIIELNQVIVQLIKLRQVASGFIYDINHRPVWLKSYKLKLLKELLISEDYFANKKKIVIWCAHTAGIYRVAQLAKELNIRAVVFSGGNRKRKDRARKQFRDNSKIRFFIGQVDSGVGMNELVVADTAIYYSNSFKVVSRQQSEPRIRRRGSERHKNITYVDLITENTIDKHILKSIKSKISLANYILTRIKSGQRLSQLLK